VAGFRKEFSHEATELGCEDESEDRAGGSDGSLVIGDLHRIRDWANAVLPLA